MPMGWYWECVKRLFLKKKLIIESGDLILLYTDGLTKAENNNGEIFGIECVCNIISKHAQQSPDKIIEILLEQLIQFCQNKAFNDDITLMILEFL